MFVFVLRSDYTFFWSGTKTSAHNLFGFEFNQPRRFWLSSHHFTQRDPRESSVQTLQGLLSNEVRNRFVALGYIIN